MTTDITSSSLRMRLFGPFDVQVNGQPLPKLRSRKHQALLALLALRAGRAVQRGWLAGTLWPQSSEAAAFHSLRQSLADVRRALEVAAAGGHNVLPTRPRRGGNGAGAT